jgi:transcriptional regulator with XRE-family HTH domain
MPPKERSIDRGTRRGTAIVVELGRELRLARLQHGLSQEALGHAIGMSDTQVGRIERGQVPGASVGCLARLLSVAGLELSARAYPTGAPLRDKAQLAWLNLSEDRLRPPSRGGRKCQSAQSVTFGSGTRCSAWAGIEWASRRRPG